MSWTFLSGLKKLADYGDTFVHDFYDKHWVASDPRKGDKPQLTAYYKALNNAFNKILQGKHDGGYNENGILEDASPVSELLIDVFGKGAIPYAEWKKQTAKAIAAGDPAAYDLTWPNKYYVRTSGGKFSLTRAGGWADDPAALQKIYQGDNKLSAVLAALKQKGELEASYADLYKRRDKISKPYMTRLSAVDKAEQQAVRAVERSINKLEKERDKIWDKHGYDSKEERALDRQLKPLFAEHKRLRKPFTQQTSKILREMDSNKELTGIDRLLATNDDLMRELKDREY